MPGESQGQKSLADHSSWIAESDTTEVTKHSTAHNSFTGDEKWSGFILKVERKNCNNASGPNTRKNAIEIRKVAVKTSLEKGKYLLET